jgi:single-strand DNA-binding protein
MYHRITIVGNLGKDPEMKYTTDGKAVTTFSVAASNRKDETAWFRVTTWEKQAETCNQYLHKGSKVLVEGRLKAEPNVYQRKDGTWGASYEVTAESVRFLTAKGEQVESADLDVPF